MVSNIPFSIPEHSLDRDCTTLSRHVLQQLQSFSSDAQDLSAIMSRIALAGKLIASDRIDTNSSTSGSGVDISLDCSCVDHVLFDIHS